MATPPLVFGISVVSPSRKCQITKELAERVGFEPTLEFPLNTLSKRAPSATRPSLRRESWEGTAATEALVSAARSLTTRAALFNSMGESVEPQPGTIELAQRACREREEGISRRVSTQNRCRLPAPKQRIDLQQRTFPKPPCPPQRHWLRFRSRALPAPSRFRRRDGSGNTVPVPGGRPRPTCHTPCADNS